MTNESLVKLIWKFFGVISLGNGIWMLGSSFSWFSFIPGVEDSGHFNSHFVRDVGVVYFLCGVGSIWCASNIHKAFHVHLGITSFISLHALLHIYETAVGQLPADHWYLDFPLVIFPGIVLIYITPSVRKLQRQPS